MPLYEYQCDACSHRFERIQKFSDPPADTCPTCGGTVKKLLSSPAIQFKGSGWYITDYAGGRSNSASSTSAGDSDGKSEAKGDGKSDTKGDGKKDSDKKSAGESSTTKSDTSSSSASSPTTTKD